MKKNKTELLIRRPNTIGGAVFNRCVVANPACYRFRHHSPTQVAPLSPESALRLSAKTLD
jgi:hypothetical protein